MTNLTYSPKIISIESIIGSQEISNKDLSDRIRISEENILAKTGIKRRYHCNTETENLYVLMATAASKAITNANITTDIIDGIYTASNPSGDFLLPNTTSIVASLLEKNDFYGWFGGSGCTGGILALENAYNKLAVDTMNGKMSYYLVIAGDQTSNLLEKDSIDQILFSDSASAMIITNHDVENWHYNIQSVNIYTEIQNLEALRLTNKEFELHHEGKKIYRFASQVVPQYIRKTFHNRQFPKDVFLIPHQANLRIIENITKELNIEESRVYSKLVREKGNTSPSSTFIALDDLKYDKLNYKNILVATFGEGLNIGIAQLEKNNSNNTCINKQPSEKVDELLKQKYKKIYDEKWKIYINNR